MTNLLSGCFGVLALLFLLAVSRRGRLWPFALLATCFYLLSIFSKEDFVLPPLLLAGSLALFGSANRRKVSVALVGFLGCLGGLIVHNTFFIRGPFFGSVASGTDRRIVIPGKAPITVLPLQDAASYGDLLFVQFDQEGRGTLRRGREALVRSPPTSVRKRYILQLVPPQATVGELFQRQPTGNAVISILGEGFAPGDAVYWDTQRLESSLGSSKVLRAAVPPSLLLEPRVVTVSVRDPDDPWRPELSAQFRVLPASDSQR